MRRSETRALSPAEQAETDRAAEAVLAMLKRVLRPGQPFDKAAHDAWLEELAAHSEACDCAACVDSV
jgi:hypothetical protein